MPPPKVITVIVRAVGARQTAREMDRVGKSIDETENATKKLSRATRRADATISPFARALFLLQLRLVNMGVGGLFAAGVLAALGPELITLASAGATAIAVLGPLGGLLAGVFDRFKNTSDIVGRPANRLKHALTDLQKTARQVIAPGADLVLGALADAIRTLMPLLKQLQIPMMIFASYVVGAINTLAQGLLAMGPQLISLISQLGPFMGQAAELVLNLGQVFLNMARNGIPFLERFLDWLISITSGENSLGVAGRLFNSFSDLMQEVGRVIGHLWDDLKPLLAIGLEGLIWALDQLTGFLKGLNDKWDTFGPLVDGAVLLVAAIIAASVVGPPLIAVIGGVGTAIVALSGSIAGILVLLAGLGLVLWLLYDNWGAFRDIVNEVWETLKGFFSWLTEQVMGGPLVQIFQKVLGMMDKVDGFLNRHPWIFGQEGSLNSTVAKSIINPFWGIKDLLAGPNSTYPTPPATPLPVPGAGSPFGGVDPAAAAAGQFATVPIRITMPDGTVLADVIAKALLQAASTR